MVSLRRRRLSFGDHLCDRRGHGHRSEDIVTATGTVEPTNQVELSSELSGTMAAVLVDYNDAVVEGQVLARLKTDQLEAAVALAKATLAARQADVHAGGSDRCRETGGPQAGRGAPGQEVHLDRDLRGRQGRQRSLRCRAFRGDGQPRYRHGQSRDCQSDLEKASIRSPINGVVLSRDVEPGQIVASSLSAPVLFTLAEDLTEMELQVDIDEADVGHINGGEAATFTVEAYGDQEFEARITQLRLSPETVEGVVTYKAILSVDNKDLLSGQG